MVHLRFQPERLPNGELQTGPHSIYFQMLGEHGYPGLLLFLGLIASCFLSLRSLRRISRHCPPLQWVERYTYVLDGAILAFMISGAFLEFANFDLWYLIVGIIAAIKLHSESTLYAWRQELAEPLPLADSFSDAEAVAQV
jgi:O-antigen ligase